MSLVAMDWVVNHNAGGTSNAALLLVIAYRADDDGVTFTGRTQLAEDLSAHAATISATFKRLEAAGLVARVRRTRENGSRTSDWTILAPQAADRGEMVDSRTAETRRRKLVPRPDAVAALTMLGRDSQGSESQGSDSSRQGRESLPHKVANHGGPYTSVDTSGHTARARELCNQLADAITEPGIPKPPITSAWLEEAEAMLVEGIDHRDIANVIAWATNDAFWSGRITDPRALRRNWTTLRKQYGGPSAASEESWDRKMLGGAA